MELIVLVGVGLVAGTLGSLLGLGGGFLVVPALIFVRAMDPRIATGTSVAIIVPTMLVALWRRGLSGHVEWGVAWQVALGAVAGAFVGSALATRMDPLWIRRTFAVVLAGLAALLAFKK